MTTAAQVRRRMTTFDYIYRSFAMFPERRGQYLSVIRRAQGAHFIRIDGQPILNLEDGGNQVPVEFQDGTKVIVPRSTFVRRDSRLGRLVAFKVARGDTEWRDEKKRKR